MTYSRESYLRDLTPILQACFYKKIQVLREGAVNHQPIKPRSPSHLPRRPDNGSLTQERAISQREGATYRPPARSRAPAPVFTLLQQVSQHVYNSNSRYYLFNQFCRLLDFHRLIFLCQCPEQLLITCFSERKEDSPSHFI
ncbi:hypothetical protein ASPVEDRAFT_644068 [Aspergillus versicolor CBS 583.65]|uniref:Uncharacterized protein n=1 Tax=Aspergillus versicolor CBS 583.65 TaxID=1036611 RepID=A0A1L9PJA8_ASPVE|nr:uncharacterized protein ASPVEDRAFT_644068 [Aspergillus versicolor CBS 583.65]OJJ01609.1 hypothetical protein ASPVEDRAFT_644068 [Aspergillus versicolor CBS 583.65]